MTAHAIHWSPLDVAPDLRPSTNEVYVEGLVAQLLELTAVALQELYEERTVTAIETGEWTGVAVADVLADAGVLPGAGHVVLEGPHARVSIPLEQALRPEVLIAWAMDARPLTPGAGAPLRIVVPGYAGARDVRWVQRIAVTSGPPTSS